ncbi:MAG: hypothetical protein VKP72_12505 [bacterium]|nr:hypothetical protein [bacterium]
MPATGAAFRKCAPRNVVREAHLHVLAYLTSLLCILTACTGTPGLRDTRNDLPVSTGLRGQILDASNRPVQDARIRAFPAGSPVEGSGLVSNHSGALVSHASGNLTQVWAHEKPVVYRVTGLAGSTVTRMDGTFDLPLDPGRYNLEVESNTSALKAWQPEIVVAAREQNALGAIQVAPTGTLRGRIRSRDARVTDLTGVEVYVPGSGYLAKVTRDGWYELSGIPRGRFELVAWHLELGQGGPDALAEVRSGEVTEVPEIVIRPDSPEIEAVLSASGSLTDNGAPGSVITLKGSGFGASKGRPFDVAIEGLLATTVDRSGDDVIRFTVPVGARSGNLVVRVGGQVSPAMPFRVLASVALKAPNSPFQVKLNQRRSLLEALEVKDTEGLPVFEVKASEGQPKTYLAPNVTFRTSGTAGQLEAPDRMLGTAEGELDVQPEAGSLLIPSFRVRITNNPTPDPSPRVGGGLAPDDPGSIGVHHAYLKARNGVRSEFVWIPVFQAFQLIRPSACGPTLADRAVGSWVASRPAAGIENMDWACETFGGFYAGKYEASRADAVPGSPDTGQGATPGSSTTLKVAPSCVPWTGIDWDTAVRTCHAYDARCHLMEDDEWTALAVWAMIHGIPVHGNNSLLADTDRPNITFVDDPTYGDLDRALTGTATCSNWTAEQNLTTHTGTTAGVHDLNGNVWEWTATIGRQSGTGHYVVSEEVVPVRVDTGYISSLATDPRLRRYGVPGATGPEPGPGFDGDYFLEYRTTNTKPVRGGHFSIFSTGAGLWALGLHDERGQSREAIGFRPALRY